MPQILYSEVKPESVDDKSSGLKTKGEVFEASPF